MKHKLKNKLKLKLKIQRRLVNRVLTVVLLVLIGIAAFNFLTKPTTTEAAWFDKSFSFRKLVPITNTSGSNKTDFQLELSLDTESLVTSGSIEPDCRDIRFTTLSGTKLNYWLEPNTCNTTTTKVFVKVPTIYTTGTDIYWYYGNPQVLTESNPEQTFTKVQDGPVAAWPLDDTDTNQSYARTVNQYQAEGRNIVINGGFDSDTVWTKGTGWTISGGVATAVSAPSGGSGNISQSVPIVVGKTYKVTYTISNYSSGSIRALVGDGGVGSSRTANGTYTETIAASGTATLFFQVTTLFSGSIDNVSLVQVNIPASSTDATNLLTDGDMEASGISSWTSINSAILTKETTNPYAGNQVIKVTRNGTDYPAARQSNILTAGQPYRVYGYVRSDGSATPVIVNNTTLFTGSTSTSWQPFDTLFIATNTELNLQCNSSGTQYCEFDAVTVTLDTTIRSGELLLDNGMEESGTNYWTTDRNAVITKNTSNPHGGSYTLRVAYNGTTTPNAIQPVLSVGKKFRITGYARGDGSFSPQIINNNVGNLFVGTTSTNWQYFDVTFTAGDWWIQLACTNTSAGYCEYDDVSITEVTPLVGTFNSSSTYKPTTNTTANGHLSKAYSFDGTNDYVNIYSSDLNSVFNPNEGTAVLWAKVTNAGVWSDGAQRSILTISDGSNNNQVAIVKSASGTYLTTLYTAGGIAQQGTPASSLSHTNWFMVALSWSKSSDQIKVYYNGTQSGSTATGLGAWAVNIASASIGSNSGTSQYWSGLINDVRLYNRALSADEIGNMYSASTDIQAYNTSNYLGKDLIRQYDTTVSAGTLGSQENGPSPIAYWKFDDGQGQTTQDETPNNNDGTLGATSSVASDDPTWQTEDMCVSGKCLKFDGADKITTQDKSYFSPSENDLTVSIWAKVPSGASARGSGILGAGGGAGRYLISKANTLNFEWGIQNDSNDQICIVLWNANSSNYADTCKTMDVNDNLWHLYTFSIDYNNVLRFYVDGKEAGNTTTFSGIMSDGTQSVTIGGRGDSADESFDGYLDEPKIYSYARSATQIKADYAMGASVLAGRSNNNALSNGLVGYWKMDETSGTTVADTSGNGNNGTLTNAQETGTADASGGSTTVLVDTDGDLSVSDDAYNGMMLRVTNTCGSITANTERTISDYTGSTKTFTVNSAFASTLDSCQYQIIHQVGGKYGSGLRFDGSQDVGYSLGDFIQVADDDTLDFGTGNFTISAWINKNSIKSAPGIVSKIYGGQNGFRFRMNTATQISIEFLEGETWRQYPSTGLVSNNIWQHITVSVDREGLARFFINGQDAGSSDISAYSNLNISNSGDIVIADDIYCRAAYCGQFNGLMDEVRMYNRALTPSEVSDLYNYAPGPVGHWTFDEGTGTTVADSSGVGNNGTASTSTLWAPGKFGSAINAETGYVDITPTGSLDIDKGNMSVSMWFKMNSIPTGQTWPIDQAFCGSNSNGYQVGISNFYIQTMTKNGSTNVYSSSDSTLYNDKQWHHVEMIVDRNASNRIKLYIDGLHNSSSLGATDISDWDLSSSPLRIGKGNCASTQFNGLIDDVKIYNYARTPEQILQDMNGGGASNPAASSGQILPDPVAYWKFDELSGQTINNSSVLGTATTSNGTLGASSASSSDDPTWKTTAECKKNGCLSFDGTTDKVTIPTTTELPRYTFTASLWFKTAGTSQTIAMFGPKYGNTRTFRLQTNASGILYAETGDTSQTTITGTKRVNDNTWHHAVVIRTGSTSTDTFSIYLDNKLEATTTNPEALLTVLGSLSLGASNIPTEDFFNGSIDEFKLWNVALTPDQIQQDYNLGVSMNMGTGTDYGSAPHLANGLVGYWKMDETSWTNNCSTSTVLDSSGLGNNGISCPNSSGSTGGASGKFNKGGIFDGTDDYVQISNSSLPTGNSSRTISVWIYPTDVSLFKSILYWGNNSSNQATTLDLLTSGIRFGFYGNDLNTNTNLITVNTWNHVVATFDGNKRFVYINGTLAAQDTTTTNTASGNLLIGQRQSTNYFPGSVDELRIYNRALSPDEIRQLADWAPGPVGHWKLDDEAGSTAKDSSGNGNNGTLVNGPDWTLGKNGSGLKFDGVNDYASIIDPASGALDFGLGDMTLQSWFKTTWIPSAGTPLIDKKGGGSNAAGYNLNLSSNGQAYFRIANGSTQHSAQSNIQINDGRWHQVTGVLSRNDNSKLKIYVDGNLVGTNTNDVSAWNIDSIQNLDLGKLNAVESYYPGLIDDVKIYNYARTPAQVSYDYNSGKPIAHWKLDECQGTTVNDASGNGNSGTITIGATGSQTSAGTCNTSGTAWGNGVTGKRNYSLNFDGTDDYVSVANPTIDDFGTGPMSVSTWVKTTTTDFGTIIDNKTAGTNDAGFNLIINATAADGKIYWRVGNGTTQYATGHTTDYSRINDGNWHHVVGVLTRGTVNDGLLLYIDGKLVSSYTSSIPAGYNITSNTNLYFGTYAPNPSIGKFSGQIDDVQLFNYSLSPLQIRQLYTGGAVRFGPITGAP